MFLASINLIESCQSILRNPLTIYLRFLINWWRNKLKFKDFYQGYLALVLYSDMEPNVSVYDSVLLSTCSIGSFSYVSANSKILQTSIGKFCCIGPHCLLGFGMHPSKQFVSNHPIFYSTKKEQQAKVTFADKDYFEEKIPIQIGNDVWIGANVVVIDGVTIGDGAIIAAGAVVTQDVPPYAIYGGVPAKLIRYRFDQETIDFLLKFKWWDKEREWLKTNLKDFHDIEKFLQAYSKF